MTSMTPGVAAEVERYLRTGDSDPNHAAWSGANFIESARLAHGDLENALIAEVRRRSGSRRPPEVIHGLYVVAFTRSKVERMVRGHFPRAEQDAVLTLIERSVVYLTPDNIEEVLQKEMRWPGSAWTIANLYLGGIDAELLSEDAPRLVGFSQETTCYVSPAYFEEEDPFADFVVHEVAHIFHNCKRRSVGLVETRRREWLLDIAFRKRETFAYACEAYARILERANTRSARAVLAGELDDDFGTGDERVGRGEIAEVVRQAAARRNGWKVILGMCAATLGGRRVAASPPDPATAS
jgi:hypothetical protein